MMVRSASSVRMIDVWWELTGGWRATKNPQSLQAANFFALTAPGVLWYNNLTTVAAGQ